MFQLIKFDQVKKALSEAVSIDEVLDIKDKMEALKLYLRQHGDSRNMQNQCALISIQAQQKAANIVNEMQESGELAKAGNPQLSSDRTIKLDDIGIDRRRLNDYRKVQAVPDEILQQYAKMVNGEDNATC